MKSIWSPGQVKWTKSDNAEPVLWSLWALAIALLCLWLAAIAFGFTLGGWIHLLAAGAILVGAVCSYEVFRYGRFLERPFFRRSAARKARRAQK